MKRELTVVFALLLMAAGVWADDQPVRNQSEADRINYSVGYQVGGDFRRQGWDLDPELLLQGVRDAFADAEPKMIPAQMQETLISLKAKLTVEQTPPGNVEDAAFLKQYAAREGVVVLANGIQYRILSQGTGPKPSLQDSVKIHFLTRTTDGTEVSSTYQAQAPKVYRLDKVISGLQAVLPLIPQGSRLEVVIPPGHGGRHSKDFLDRRGILIYQIELLSVIRNEPPKG